MQYAVEYTGNRRAFRGGLCDLEGIQFMIADMAAQTEAARLLVYQAALSKGKIIVRFTF